MEASFEIDAHSVILHRLAEIRAAGEDQTSQIEVLWNIVLALLDCLINVHHCILEVI